MHTHTHTYTLIQVSEVRSAMSVLGLSMEGNKYDMIERLITHNMVCLGAGVGKG